MLQVGTIVQYRPIEMLGCPECGTPVREMKRNRSNVQGNGNALPAIVLDNNFPDGAVSLVVFSYSGQNKIIPNVKEGTTPGTFCLVPEKVAGDRTVAGQGLAA